MTYDLSLRCDGDEYRRMSAFNVAFVVGVVVGWPAFIVWYLRRVQLQGRTADESVLSRVGFLFEQYRPEYLYWDVVETVRKLYLVTVVAFFESGTMMQLVLSVIVSSMAFAYHVYSLPYKDRWLNVLQGACLFMIWASLQAGMLMVTTQPSLGAGSALLTSISVANIIMLISPALLIVLAVLQVVPASLRARISATFGFVNDAETSKDPTVSNSNKSNNVSNDVSTLATVTDGSTTHSEHDTVALHRVDGVNEDETVASDAAVQLEMVERPIAKAIVDTNTGFISASSTIASTSCKELIEIYDRYPRRRPDIDVSAPDAGELVLIDKQWLLALAKDMSRSTASTVTATAVQQLIEQVAMYKRLNEQLHVQLQLQQALAQQR